MVTLSSSNQLARLSPDRALLRLMSLLKALSLTCIKLSEQYWLIFEKCENCSKPSKHNIKEDVKRRVLRREFKSSKSVSEPSSGGRIEQRTTSHDAVFFRKTIISLPGVLFNYQADEITTINVKLPQTTGVSHLVTTQVKQRGQQKTQRNKTSTVTWKWPSWNLKAVETEKYFFGRTWQC